MATTRRSAAARAATVSGKRKWDKAVKPGSPSKCRRIARPSETRQQDETLPKHTKQSGALIGKIITEVVPQRLQPWEMGWELWGLVAKLLSEPIENHWPYKTTEHHDGVSTHLQMEKVRRAWQDLSSLARTCRWMHGVATEWLYRWVSVGNGRSAASFLNTIYHQPERKRYVRHIAILEIPDDDELRATFLNLDWGTREMIDAKTRPTFLDRGVSAIINRSERSYLVPLIVAMILSGLRTLRSLHLAEPISRHKPAQNPLTLIQQSALGMLSELNLVMRGANKLSHDWVPSATGPEGGIKRLHVANTTFFGETTVDLCASNTASLMEKVESLQLSFVHMENHCWQTLFKSTRSLRELHIRLAGVGNSVAFPWLGHLNMALPMLAKTLDSLTIDSCYVRGFKGSIDPQLLSNLPLLPNLKHLRIPGALLFPNPLHFRNATILDVLPASITVLEIQEVWNEYYQPSHDFQQLQYKRLVATFFQDACRQLKALAVLRLVCQWEYCLLDEFRTCLPANDKVAFEFIPLESSSPSSMSKMACAYLATEPERAKDTAWHAVRSSLCSRSTTVRLAQVFAGLGQLDDAMKLLTRLHPPVSQDLVRSITDMFQQRRRA